MSALISAALIFALAMTLIAISGTSRFAKWDESTNTPPAPATAVPASLGDPGTPGRRYSDPSRSLGDPGTPNRRYADPIVHALRFNASQSLGDPGTPNRRY